MNILITGGAGYIGSHATRYLLDEGHKVVVVDNLSHGFQAAIDPRAIWMKISVQNFETMVDTLKDHHIEAVIHFAGYIEVGESVKSPSKYYENNLVGTFCLLEALRSTEVKKIVFSSTAAVYGNPLEVPIKETNPCRPINPYGHTKRASELMIHDYCQAYGMGYAVLRYFNVAGAAADGAIGEAHYPETHLIPKILQSLQNLQEPLKVFGHDYPTFDGTCIRDYIHVMDLVKAHALAVKAIRPGEGNIYNLGSEKGFSVKQVISTCEQVTGRKISYEVCARREGDPAILVASSEKIRRELGWVCDYPHLEQMIRHAWLWHSQHPQGYKSICPIINKLSVDFQ